MEDDEDGGKAQRTVDKDLPGALSVDAYMDISKYIPQCVDSPTVKKGARPCHMINESVSRLSHE